MADPSNPIIPVEGTILADLSRLGTLLYAKMRSAAALLTEVPSISSFGLDSSRTNNPLPPIALKLDFVEINVDRKRPTPSYGNRLVEDTGEESILEYDNHGVYTGHLTKVAKHPLPLELIYDIRGWCHSAITQMQIDQAILQTFPERGVLVFSIEDTEYQFPVELLGIQTLDDLKQNYRERVYRYRIEAYVTGSIPDLDLKSIINVMTGIHQGQYEEDINLPGNSVPIASVVDVPNEES